VQAFDAVLAGPVAEYIKISKEVGGDVQKHVRTRVLPPLHIDAARSSGSLRARFAVSVCIPLELYSRMFIILEDSKRMQMPR